MFFLECFAPCTAAPDSFVWPALPVVFPIADDGSSIFPVTQAKTPAVLPQEILLALPSLAIQTPASPYHCCHCHPAPGPYHLSAGLLRQPPNCSPCSCLSLTEQPEQSCCNMRQTTTHPCLRGAGSLMEKVKIPCSVRLYRIHFRAEPLTNCPTPLVNSSPAIDGSLFLKQAKPTPAPGPLHWLFILSAMLFPQITV